VIANSRDFQVRLPQVDLNLFIVFDAIYTKRNLTRASEILNITQPAVSNSLSRMRKIFNDELFVSTPKGMVPTPVAENIQGRISEALRMLNSSVLDSELFLPENAEKVFRLSMNDSTESLLLPALTAKLEREAPGIQIESYYIPREQIPDELAAGRVDIAIDAPLINDAQLHHQHLLYLNYICMLRKDHPFKGEVLSMEDYLGFEHIHVSSRRQGLGVVDAALNSLGKKRNIKSRVQHHLVAPLIALQSDLALTTLKHLLRHVDARILPLPFELSRIDWHMYWHRSSDKDQANHWIRSVIAEIARTQDE
jgi:DNA-binding transcriptional LysR family regulator